MDRFAGKRSRNLYMECYIIVNGQMRRYRFVRFNKEY